MKKSGRLTELELKHLLEYIEQKLYPIFYRKIFTHNEGRFHTFANNTHLTYSKQSGYFNKVKFEKDLKAIEELLTAVSIQHLTEQANLCYSSQKHSAGKNLEVWIRSIHQTIQKYSFFGVNSHKMDILTRAIDHHNQISFDIEITKSQEIPSFDPDQTGGDNKKVA